MSHSPSFRPRRGSRRGPALATMLVLTLMTGCTGGESPQKPPPTSTAPPSSASPTLVPTSRGPSAQRDEELAAIVARVRVNQKPLEVFPIATVRQAGTGATGGVAPTTCGFAATGLLPSIMEGRPAAMGISSAGLTLTLVDAGADSEAERVLGQRDTVLDAPECRRVTITQRGRTLDTSISEAPTSGAGLTRARVLVSGFTGAGTQSSSASLLGRRGTVLVLVNSNGRATVALLEALASQIVAQL